jgi:hypothetical protein
MGPPALSWPEGQPMHWGLGRGLNGSGSWPGSLGPVPGGLQTPLWPAFGFCVAVQGRPAPAPLDWAALPGPVVLRKEKLAGGHRGSPGVKRSSCREEVEQGPRASGQTEGEAWDWGLAGGEGHKSRGLHGILTVGATIRMTIKGW